MRKHCDCRLQCVNVENAYGFVPFVRRLSHLFLLLILPLSTFPWNVSGPFFSSSCPGRGEWEEQGGWAVGVKGRVRYITLNPPKFCLSPGLGTASHTSSLYSFTKTGKLTHLPPLQPNNPHRLTTTTTSATIVTTAIWHGDPAKARTPLTLPHLQKSGEH